jgi:hypothetical protein
MDEGAKAEDPDVVRVDVVLGEDLCQEMFLDIRRVVVLVMEGGGGGCIRTRCHDLHAVHAVHAVSEGCWWAEAARPSGTLSEGVGG